MSVHYSPTIGDKVYAVSGLRTADGAEIMPGERGYIIGYRGREYIIEWDNQRTDSYLQAGQFVIAPRIPNRSRF